MKEANDLHITALIHASYIKDASRSLNRSYFFRP